MSDVGNYGTNFCFYFCADKTEYGTIGSWLSTIGLGQYENVLIINGFDNIKMLVSSSLYYCWLDGSQYSRFLYLPDHSQIWLRFKILKWTSCAIYYRCSRSSVHSSGVWDKQFTMSKNSEKLKIGVLWKNFSKLIIRKIARKVPGMLLSLFMMDEYQPCEKGKLLNMWYCIYGKGCHKYISNSRKNKFQNTVWQFGQNVMKKIYSKESRFHRNIRRNNVAACCHLCSPIGTYVF